MRFLCMKDIEWFSFGSYILHYISSIHKEMNTKFCFLIDDLGKEIIEHDKNKPIKILSF